MDICPCNICSGNICPYQHYFSCYSPDFDQTLKSALADVNCHGEISQFNICPYQQYLSCYQFWPNFKGMFLEPSLNHTICQGDICKGNIYPNDICTWQQYLISEIRFLDLKFFLSKIIRTKIF